MLNQLFLLASSAATTVADKAASVATTIEETTGELSLTNVDGSIISADEAIDTVTQNVATWWEKLNLFDRFIGILPSLIVAIITIVIGVILSKLATKLVHKTLTLKGVDPSIHGFIASIVKLIIMTVFLLSALSKFGFNINTFVAAIGAAGVTAGLGLQASVSQFASGIQILINHPFKNGDFIEVGTATGNVADIHLMYTVINTVDNKRIIIPNSQITNSSITNYSAENKRRVDLTFDISYASDINKAKNIILGLAEASEFALTEPIAVVFVNSHEASSIRLVARIWCETSHYWDLYFEMMEKVKLSFDREQVSIPFNQLDVTIVGNNDKTEGK